MIYLIALTIFLVALFLFLLIDIRKSAHMLYIIPITLLFTGGSYFYIDSLFGYPVKQTNEGKFYLISYSIPEAEDVIYLWVLLQDEDKPKSVFIDYTPERHEELIRAQEKMNEGRFMEGDFNDMLEVEGEEAELGQYPAGEHQDINQGTGGTNKSKGGGLSLLEVKTSTALPAKAAHGGP
jgi:hypothetical protein